MSLLTKRGPWTQWSDRLPEPGQEIEVANQASKYVYFPGTYISPTPGHPLGQVNFGGKHLYEVYQPDSNTIWRST